MKNFITEITDFLIFTGMDVTIQSGAGQSLQHYFTIAVPTMDLVGSFCIVPYLNQYTII